MNIIKSGQMNGYADALFNFAPYMIKKNDLTKEQKEKGLVATNDRWLSKSVVPFYGVTMVAVVVVSVVLNWTKIFG